MKQDVILGVPETVSKVLNRFREKLLARPDISNSDGERLYNLFKDGKTPTVEDIESIFVKDSHTHTEPN